jgi:hypothetical protein
MVMSPLLLSLLLAGTTAVSTVHHPAHVVNVRAVDFSFAAPSTVRPGVTTFRFTNAGTQLHHLSIVRLPAGKTLGDFTAAMKAEGHPPMWATPVGGPNAAIPGATSEATLDLTPGNYVMACFITSPGTTVPHVMNGMTRSLTVRGAREPGVMPVADVDVRLSDFAFTMSRPMAAGHHTVRVTNDAPQPHELVIVRLAQGKSMSDVGAWVDSDMVGPPPGLPLGGMGPLAKGGTGTFDVRLTPGIYGMICFMPDMTDGKPHFRHGMVKQFDIALK